MREASKEELLETIEKLEAETYKLSLEIAQRKMDYSANMIHKTEVIVKLEKEIENWKTLHTKERGLNYNLQSEAERFCNVPESPDSSEGVG